jgi:hypothetical protein
MRGVRYTSVVYIALAHSSSGQGHRPLKAEITGSNPVCATSFPNTSRSEDAESARHIAITRIVPYCSYRRITHLLSIEILCARRPGLIASSHLLTLPDLDPYLPGILLAFLLSEEAVGNVCGLIPTFSSFGGARVPAARAPFFFHAKRKTGNGRRNTEEGKRETPSVA